MSARASAFARRRATVDASDSAAASSTVCATYTGGGIPSTVEIASINGIVAVEPFRHRVTRDTSMLSRSSSGATFSAICSLTRPRSRFAALAAAGHQAGATMPPSRFLSVVISIVYQPSCVRTVHRLAAHCIAGG